MSLFPQLVLQDQATSSRQMGFTATDLGSKVTRRAFLEASQDQTAAQSEIGKSGWGPVVVLSGFLVALPSTSGGGLLPALSKVQLDFSSNTSSGIFRSSPRLTGQSESSTVHKLRRLSGLTWDQIAEIFGVTRRTIHLWASGKAMTAKHEEKLHWVYGAVRLMDKGEAKLTRTALLSVGSSGMTALEELRRDVYSGASRGQSAIDNATMRAGPNMQSDQTRRFRGFPSPAQILDTVADFEPVDRGGLSRAVSRRLKPPK